MAFPIPLPVDPETLNRIPNATGPDRLPVLRYPNDPRAQRAHETCAPLWDPTNHQHYNGCMAMLNPGLDPTGLDPEPAEGLDGIPAPLIIALVVLALLVLE